MRYREPFTVFPRKLKKKTIYYFQTRLPDGARTNPKSTGQDTVSAAKAWCQKQVKSGKIATKYFTLQEYSKNWYLYNTCPYIKGKLKRGGTFSRARAKAMRVWLEKKIWPIFGSKSLNEITPKMIEEWMFKLKDETTTMGTTRSAASVSHIYAALRMLLNEAERLGDLVVSPCRRVKPLKENGRKKGILKRDEYEKLFDPDTIEIVWKNRYFHYVLNLFACATGLRQGECLGLQWENVFEDHIYVCHSFEKQFRELKNTKTEQVRNVPISSRMYSKLLQMKMMYGNSGPYVFSLDSEFPIYDSTVRKWYDRALNNIGIEKDQRKTRNLSFHSWRHGLNTRLIEAGLSGELIREITGHKTMKMTQHYSHVDTAQVDKLRQIIEEIG